MSDSATNSQPKPIYAAATAMCSTTTDAFLFYWLAKGKGSELYGQSWNGKKKSWTNNPDSFYPAKGHPAANSGPACLSHISKKNGDCVDVVYFDDSYRLRRRGFINNSGFWSDELVDSTQYSNYTPPILLGIVPDNPTIGLHIFCRFADGIYCYWYDLVKNQWSKKTLVVKCGGGFKPSVIVDRDNLGNKSLRIYFAAGGIGFVSGLGNSWSSSQTVKLESGMYPPSPNSEVSSIIYTDAETSQSSVQLIYRYDIGLLMGLTSDDGVSNWTKYKLGMSDGNCTVVEFAGNQLHCVHVQTLVNYNNAIALKDDYLGSENPQDTGRGPFHQVLASGGVDSPKTNGPSPLSTRKSTIHSVTPVSTVWGGRQHHICYVNDNAVIQHVWYDMDTAKWNWSEFKPGG